MDELILIAEISRAQNCFHVMLLILLLIRPWTPVWEGGTSLPLFFYSYFFFMATNNTREKRDKVAYQSRKNV